MAGWYGSKWMQDEQARNWKRDGRIFGDEKTQNVKVGEDMEFLYWMNQDSMDENGQRFAIGI